MARCSICDYVDGFGSEYTMKGPFGNRVIFNEKRQEFLCTDCNHSIFETINEDEFMDSPEGYGSKTTLHAKYSDFKE
jgi:hypothetical protein